uniref:Uncharacterized protein LOC111108428 isoform X3 n=1 Tax=Crassostrea virginica TaxID=6565 RepID=A0A8B8BA11_CRAVI|nr:uncharacterized protein LOC111108428 isoform X3 [Crassostrea virginica]
MMFVILCVVVIVSVPRSSAAYNLNGEVCLQRALEFSGTLRSCGFYGSKAWDYFIKDQYDDTCQTKCSVTIQNLHSNRWYYLKNIHLKVIDKSHSTICSSRQEDNRSRDLVIDCSPRTYDAVDLNKPCQINEQCRHSPHALCLQGKCGCTEGYSVYDSAAGCLKDAVDLNKPCQINEQCRHSPHALCLQGKCGCTEGYSVYDSAAGCLKDAVDLNKPCQINEQCRHSPHALCLQGKCGCTEGYSVYDSAAGCLKDNVTVGDSCAVNAQCKGTPLSANCENSTCTCTKGYISLGQLCYEEAIALNMPCMFHEQCFDFPHALCLNGNCDCIEGYSAHNTSKCLQDNVDIGESCEVNEQCRGTANSTVCENSTCTCTEGYISLGEHCYEGIQGNLKEALFGDQQESNVGRTLGALLGGVLLGVLITVIGFIIYKRRKNPNKRHREEPQVVFADNNAYGVATKMERNVVNDSSGNKNKRKVVNVSPYAPSDETPEYGNVSQTSVTRTEDIYNHLNEKEEQDGEDNYDHACAATGLSRGGYFDSDYSSMRDVDKGCGKSAKNGADNYFTLEQN